MKIGLLLEGDGMRGLYQRNKLDDQGNPYPVLYMKFEK